MYLVLLGFEDGAVSRWAFDMRKGYDEGAIFVSWWRFAQSHDAVTIDRFIGDTWRGKDWKIFLREEDVLNATTKSCQILGTVLREADRWQMDTEKMMF